MIPGQNLLKMALTVIQRQYLYYYKFEGRTLNSVGQDIAIYSPPIGIYGSFQPVPRVLYDKYGLNLQKKYYTFYTSNNVINLQRTVSGDQMGFNGQRYQCESNNTWYEQDGWKGILLVHVGVDVGDTSAFGFGTIPSSNDYMNFGNGNFIGRRS